VHGLQGHPQKTWSCKRVEQVPERSSHTLDVPSSPTPSLKRSSQLPKRLKFLRKSPNICSVDDIGLGREGDLDGADLDGTDFVYWPRDLLPIDCPKARIMTWGYDTAVTKGIAAPTNKGNIFAHAKDLLYALDRERPQGRLLIFVAHSLGGIIVKEVKSSLLKRKIRHASKYWSCQHS
jgi:hypothetical protein